uniref:AlNc14C34G3078 protein n=1 Tax=Albugo laibachii Nc14 TaxID=890382 RepID=F0W8E8_9STRA|nr:AlNc14C34G3078 [Albugo laibachii Nc14]|eukprot:CCA17403.1 AlNc14C34G3078 [Albugo laibachii Nc14]
MASLHEFQKFNSEKDLRSAKISILSDEFEMQNIIVHFAYEATEIPLLVYAEIREVLIQHKFQLKLGRLQKACNQIAFNKLPRFKFLIKETRLLKFTPRQYISAKDGICFVNVLGNLENNWVLGSSFLMAYSVIIDSTGEEKKYKFIPSRRPWLK